MDKNNLTGNRKGFSQRIKNICALRAFACFSAFCLLPSAFASSPLRPLLSPLSLLSFHPFYPHPAPLETVRRVRPQDRKRLRAFAPSCLRAFAPCLFFLLTSCGERERYHNLDLQNIAPVKVGVHRYEQALFSIDRQNFAQGLDAIAPEFELILTDRYAEPQNVAQLLNFVNDPVLQEAYAATQKKYRDIEWITKGIADGYRRYRYFYPNTETVKLYTYVSGYNYEEPVHFFDDNTLLVGLDNYLGATFDAYKKVQIPQYISDRMDSVFLLPDIFHALIAQNFEGNEKPELLIDYIISAGKTYYFLDILLPSVKKEDKIGYSKAQWDFCKNNEDQIWRYFIENKLLFSSNHRNIRSFIFEAPFTNDFPRESPGRIGQWIGWQIVTAYMKNNPDVTLQELMNDCDYKGILQKSGYKP